MPSVKYTDYDLVTGEIRAVGSTTGREPRLQSGLGRKYSQKNIKENYINTLTERFNKRKSFSVTSVRNGNIITLTNIPNNTLITIDNEVYEVDDGELELTLDQPVAVTFTLTHPHYLKEVLTVES